MTRAYIRLDPAFDERKYDYPDGAYAALVATLCLAEHQPERGRFRSTEYLARLLGKRGKWVRHLVVHGDLTELPDGRAYVDGWDEWQEGDWKVAERVSRIRQRPRNGRCNGGGNGERNGQANVIPSEVSVSGAELSGALTGDRPSPIESDGLMHIDQETGRLWEESCGKSPLGSGEYAANLLDDLCDRQGAERVREAIIECRFSFPRMPSPQQLATAIRNALEPLPSKPKPVDDSAEREAARHRRAVENTLRNNHGLGAHADDPHPGCPACRERSGAA